jgi:hypothetical protein
MVGFLFIADQEWFIQALRIDSSDSASIRLHSRKCDSSGMNGAAI